MSKERRSEDQRENPAEMLFRIKDSVDELKEQMLQLIDFSIETRQTATMSSHTLPLITMQHKRVVAEAFAARNSLVDVEKELAEKYASTEDLLRARSRLSEKLGYTARNFEAYLSRYRETVEQLAIKEAHVRRLELETRTQKDLLGNLEAVMTALSEMANQKRLPPDVVADLKALLHEIPKPLPAPPEETTETAGDEQ